MRNDNEDSTFSFAGIKKALGWTEEKKIQIGTPKNVVQAGGIEPGEGGSDKFLAGIKKELEKSNHPNNIDFEAFQNKLKEHVLPVDKRPARQRQITLLQNQGIHKLLTELLSGDIKESWLFKTKLVELSIELENYSCFQKFENTVLLKRQESQIKQKHEECLNNMKYNECFNIKQENLVSDPLDQQTIRQSAFNTISSKEFTAQQKITALNNALALQNVGIPEELLLLLLPKEKTEKEEKEEVRDSNLPNRIKF